MMRQLKRFFFIFVILISLAFASIWTATRYTHPQAFKHLAEQQLLHVTQQDSKIFGNIRWQIFPKPGLNVTDVQIGHPDDKNSDYNLFVQDLTFYLKLKPLLHGHLVFDQITLSHVDLNINLNQTQSLKSTSSKSIEKVNPKLSQTQSKTTFLKRYWPKLVLNTIVISDGKMTIIQDDKTLQLTQVRIETEVPHDLNAPFPIQFKSYIKHTSKTHPFKSQIFFKGLVKLPELSQLKSQLNQIELNGQLLLDGIKLGSAVMSKANTHLYYHDNQLTLNPLTLSLYGGESIGTLEYNLKTDVLSFNQIATHLEAESLTKHMSSTKISGSLDFSIQSKLPLRTKNLAQDINLSGNMSVKKGELGVFNLPQLTELATEAILAIANKDFQNIQNIILKLQPWQLSQYKGSTPFELLSIQYQTDKPGFIKFNLVLETIKLQLKGSGLVDLSTHQIDAHLMAHISTQNKSIQVIEQELGDGFPVIIKGTIENPVISPDKPLIKKAISAIPLSKDAKESLQKINQHLHTIQSIKNAVISH